MADTIITIPNDEPPAPAPPTDATLNMAVEFGAMRAEYQATQERLSRVEGEHSQTVSLLNSLSETLQELRSQTNRTEERAEVAQATATAAIVEATAEDEEDAGGLLELTPPMETKIEIETKPVGQKGFFSKLIYGP